MLTADESETAPKTLIFQLNFEKPERKLSDFVGSSVEIGVEFRELRHGD